MSKLNSKEAQYIWVCSSTIPLKRLLREAKKPEAEEKSSFLNGNGITKRETVNVEAARNKKNLRCALNRREFYRAILNFSNAHALSTGHGDRHRSIDSLQPQASRYGISVNISLNIERFFLHCSAVCLLVLRWCIHRPLYKNFVVVRCALRVVEGKKHLKS